MLKRTVTAAAAALLVSASAFAAVTFDASTGIGFVGKGDVQLAFGWNNKALQENAKNVSFTYEATTGFIYECEWTTGPVRNRKTHSVTKKEGVNVNSVIAYDMRQRNQFTGYNLSGFGSVYTIGSEPVLGESCIGEGADGVIVEVSRDPSRDEGGLYVTFNGSKVLLPETPAL